MIYFHRAWLVIVLIDQLTWLITRILISINTHNIQINIITSNKMKKNKQCRILQNVPPIIMKLRDF